MERAQAHLQRIRPELGYDEGRCPPNAYFQPQIKCNWPYDPSKKPYIWNMDELPDYNVCSQPSQPSSCAFHETHCDTHTHTRMHICRMETIFCTLDTANAARATMLPTP